MNLVLFFQENAALRYVYYKFAFVARIIPYYLIREYFLDENELNFQPKLKSLDVEFLLPSEIKIIAKNSEILEGEEELLKRYQDGCLCLGLKHEGKIVAFTWYDPRNFQFKKIIYKLKKMKPICLIFVHLKLIEEKIWPPI